MARGSWPERHRSATIRPAGQEKVCAVPWIRSLALACSALFAIALAQAASAQEPRDPLVDPPLGGAGSRFQIVGQRGWIPDEALTLSVGYTTSEDPFSFTGPWLFEKPVTVLRDGTWSFPIVLTEAFFAGAVPARPGYIVVRAQSAEQVAVNAYVFSVDGELPAGVTALGLLGSGPHVTAPLAFTLALFAAGLGALLALSGALRRPFVTA